MEQGCKVTGRDHYYESGMTSDEYREAARRLINKRIAATVDDRAEVQPVSDGAFVECWVWVPNDPQE